MAFYVGRYLLRHDSVCPAGVPAQRKDALLAVASHRTVHNTLRQQPDVSIQLN